MAGDAPAWVGQWPNRQRVLTAGHGGEEQRINQPKEHERWIQKIINNAFGH